MSSPHSIGLALASCLFLVGGCSAPTLDVMPRYGTFDLEGHFGITNMQNGPVPVADMNEAGFEKDDGFVGLRTDLDFGAPTLYVSAQLTNHGGSGTVGNTLNSGNEIILAGTAVTTDMDLGLYQLGVTFDVVPTDWFEVGLGFGLTAVDIDATMTDGFMTISTDRTLPIPVAALSAGVDLGSFEASVLVSGLEVSAGDDRVAFLDIDAFAKYRLFGGEEHLAGSIGLGYRYLNLGLEYDDNGDRIDANFRFNGPYLTFVLSF